MKKYFIRLYGAMSTFIHNKKVQYQKNKDDEKFKLEFISFKYSIIETVNACIIHYGLNAEDESISRHVGKDGVHMNYNGLYFKLTTSGVEVFFKEKPYKFTYDHFDIPQEFLKGQNLC